MNDFTSCRGHSGTLVFLSASTWGRRVGGSLPHLGGVLAADRRAGQQGAVSHAAGSTLEPSCLPLAASSSGCGPWRPRAVLQSVRGQEGLGGSPPRPRRCGRPQVRPGTSLSLLPAWAVTQLHLQNEVSVPGGLQGSAPRCPAAWAECIPAAAIVWWRLPRLTDSATAVTAAD